MKKLFVGPSKKLTHGSENYRPHFHQFKILWDHITLSKIGSDHAWTCLNRFDQVMKKCYITSLAKLSGQISLYMPYFASQDTFQHILIILTVTLHPVWYTVALKSMIKQRKSDIYLMLGSSKPLYSYSTILRILLLPFRLGIQPIKNDSRNTATSFMFHFGVLLSMLIQFRITSSDNLQTMARWPSNKRKYPCV